MKNVLILMLMTIGSHVFSQLKTWEGQHNLQGSATETFLQVTNLSGSVTVEGTEGSTIEWEAILRKGGEKLSSKGLVKKLLKDTVILYYDVPCMEFERYSARSDEHVFSPWRYSWDNSCKVDEDFTVDIIVKVPIPMNVFISTINNGDVNVTGINGNLMAKNINGGIYINRGDNCIQARTINGDIVVKREKTLSSGTDLYTLNGDINIHIAEQVDAEVHFKSYNGEMFSNVEKIQTLSPEVRPTQKKETEGIKYTWEAKGRVKFGKGGNEVSVETFNGDVFVKEKTTINN